MFYDPRDEILSTYTASYEISKNAEKCLPFPFRCFLFDRAILVFSESFFNRLRPKKENASNLAIESVDTAEDELQKIRQVTNKISANGGLIYGVGFSAKDMVTSLGGFLSWLVAIPLGSAIYGFTYAAAWMAARPMKGLLCILVSAALFSLPYFLNPK